MSKLHKQTFLQGALILVLANGLVKIIGAILKIPLANLLGPDGMGIYSTAYVMYTWLFVVATAGLPIAISKMVSESIARNKRAEAHKIFNVSFYLLMVVGFVGSAVLFLGARFFATALGNSRAYLAIIAISPALFFVGVMSAYRGYFQGLQNMIPTAISEVAEALSKLFIGLTLAYLWLYKGVEYGSAGAILGVTTGTFLGAVALFIVYRFSRNNIMLQTKNDKQKNYTIRTTKEILAELVRIAIPITVGASVFTLTNVIDMAMIMNRLKSIGFAEQQASTLYGYLSGYAVPLFNLPPTLVTPLSISIVPAIASAFAVNNARKTSITTESALRITILFALPSAVGLSILAEPILRLLYYKADETTIVNAAVLLSILGVAVFFVSIVLLTNAILQATGRVMIPVRNMLIGGIAKVGINYFLVGNPDININGAPIGTNICYLIIVVLNFIEVKKITKINFKFIDFIVKPLISVAAMAIAVIFTFNKLIVYTQSNGLSTIGGIGAGIIFYGLMLLAVGAIKREDVLMMPKGEQLLKLFNRFGLLKD